MSTAYIQVQSKPGAGRTTAALCAALALAKRLRQESILFVDMDGHGKATLSAFFSHLNRHAHVEYYRPLGWEALKAKVAKASIVVLDGEGTAYEALRANWSDAARDARAKRGNSPLGDIPPQGWVEINAAWRKWISEECADKHLISTFRVEPTMAWSSIVKGEVRIGDQARGQYEAGMGCDLRLLLDIEGGARRLVRLSDKSWSVDQGASVDGAPAEIVRRVEAYLRPYLRRVDGEARAGGVVRFEGEEEWLEVTRSAEKEDRTALMAQLEIMMLGFPNLTGMSAEAKKNRELAWFGLLGVPYEAAGRVTVPSLAKAVETIKREGWEPSRLAGWKPIAALAELGKPKESEDAASPEQEQKIADLLVAEDDAPRPKPIAKPEASRPERVAR